MQTPTEDRYLLTRNELLGKIDVLLGGGQRRKLCSPIYRRARRTILRRHRYRPEDDHRLRDERPVPERGSNQTRHSLSRDRAEPMLGREYSENTQAYVDDEVARIINGRYEQCPLPCSGEPRQA
jgi:cell division protease FtsH